MIEEFFDDLKKKSEPFPYDGDYIEDGILYCGKCKTPRQCRVKILGIESTVGCLCKCRDEKIQAEVKEKRRKIIEERRNIVFGDDSRNKNARLDTDRVTEAVQIARNYCEKLEGHYAEGTGFTLFGTPGTGKTFAIAAAANKAIEQGYSVQFVNVADLSAESNSRRNDIVSGAREPDFFFLDDLGAERGIDSMREVILGIINARYQCNKPLIVTSNIPLSYMKNPETAIERRAYERLLEVSTPIEVSGKNQRYETIRGEYEERKNDLTRGIEQ